MNINTANCIVMKKILSHYSTSRCYHRRSRATRCFTLIVLYTNVDAQCDKLATVIGRFTKLITLIAKVNVRLQEIILSPRFRKKYLHFWKYRNFLIIILMSNTVDCRIRLKSKKACLLKPVNQLDPFSRFRHVTDGQTDRHRAIAYTTLP